MLQYPVYLPELAGPQLTTGRFSEETYALCDGRHSYDQICVREGLSSKELDDRVERDPAIVVLRR